MRRLLAILALLCALPAAAREPALREAFLFAYPVHRMAVTRSQAVENARAQGRTVVNAFGHRARLAGPGDRAVTTPNNDTVYSSAWLDLRGGPLLLTLPPAPGRYHSLALMSLFTDNFAVVGTRDGGRGQTVLLAPPGWRGTPPVGARLVRAPTTDVWALVRVLVTGPDDLADAADAQRRFTVAPTPGARPTDPGSPPARPDDDPAAMLDAVNAMLGRGPLPPDRARLARRLRGWGVAPGETGAFERLPAARQAEWRARLPELVAELRGGLAASGTIREGWSWPRPGMGDFGGDAFYRAAVALGGLAALPADEAVYLTASTDAAGAPLDGARRYRLRVPPGVPLLPGGFWSVSLYEVASDGRLFFTPNAIQRYAAGDRTPGLTRDADGGLTLVIGPETPAGAGANWLPSPRGPFRLTFRAYLPRESLRGWTLPGVQPAP